MVLETKIFETRDNIPKMQALSDAGKGQCCAKRRRAALTNQRPLYGQQDAGRPLARAS
jgi:hypothetical protein